MKKQVNLSSVPIVSPAVVISIGNWEKSNLITLAWVSRVVSKPPIMSISIRPSRYSYQIIEKFKEYVINVPFSRNIRETDFCGTRTGRKVNKWKELGLTKLKGKNVQAPLIKEFPINIECKVIKRTKLGTHVIYLGEVMTVNVDEDLLNNDVLDPSKQDQISYIAGNYYKISKDPFEKHGFSIK